MTYRVLLVLSGMDGTVTISIMRYITSIYIFENLLVTAKVTG